MTHQSDKISNVDLAVLDPYIIAMLQVFYSKVFFLCSLGREVNVLQGELSRLLTDDQLFQIVRNFIQKQQFREAAQVVERLTSRLSNNPDVMVNLWDQQIIYQVIRRICFPDKSVRDLIMTLLIILSFVLTFQRCSRDAQAFLRQYLK